MFRHLRTATREQRLESRALFIPKNARRVALKGDTSGSAVHVYEQAGKFYAAAFRGTAARSEFHHSYRTAERREAHVREFFASVQSSAAFKSQQKAEKAAWTNPLTVGTILYTSWGYDQTNVEFYAVTRVSGRRVWVREIAADYESTGYMSGNTWPAMPIRFVGEETMHTAQPSGTRGAYVKISESQHAWVDEGRMHSTTSYA